MNLFWILLLTSAFGSSARARVRHVELAQDQIATVRTALGIATIVQVPERPNSVVVGDQAVFKVEYLDQAITIKPLRGGAKSNLYIYTDYRRYNVQLVTGPEAGADYVVYLDNPKTKPRNDSTRWLPIKRAVSTEGITLSVKRVAKARDGVLLIEFVLSSEKQEWLRPEWIWLTQHGITRPIQNLFLSSIESAPSEPAMGTIQVLRSDVDENAPLKIELRRKKNASLTLPKVAAWK